MAALTIPKGAVGDALERWGGQEAPEDFFDALHNRPLGESLFGGLSPNTPGDVQSAKARIVDFTRSQGYSEPQVNAMAHAGVASWASPLMNIGTAIRDVAQRQIAHLPGYLQRYIPLSPNTAEEYAIDIANTGIGKKELRGVTFSELLEEAESGGKLMLEAPPYRQSGPSRRGGGYRYISPVSGVDASDANMQRGGFLPDWVRGISLISTAQAGSGFVPGKSVTVEVEQTPEEDFAITEALMQLDEPRIPFSLPPEARGVFTEEVQAPFILDQQVDPYTSITTLPIGEEGWTPTLLSDTLEDPVTDQPRTNLDGTMTYLTNEEAMASEVQRALDRAGRIGPAPPVTSVESQLQALAELSQIDPTIAERYTDPGSQDLIDITSQVESFANIPTVQPEPEPVSSERRVEQAKAEAANKRAADKAAAKREAADKRAADKAAAKSRAMSQAQKRNIARVAKASRAAEAKREAAAKKAAEDQRKKDKEAQEIFARHQKWAAENAEKLRKREENRLKQMGMTYTPGSQFMYT